jgi:protein-tyrosine phosphatase
MTRKKRTTAVASAALVSGVLFWLHQKGLLTDVIGKVVKGIDILLARLQEQGVPAVRLWLRDHLLRVVHGVSPSDTSHIAQGLYVGGQHYRRGLPRLADSGITASLSLRQTVDDAGRGVALERHLWLPTVDDSPPTLEQLAQATMFIHDARQEGRAVYVHCASGVGRAPTTAAAYLVSLGLTPPDAWRLIRRARPFVRPKAAQIEQVERFHRCINGVEQAA